MPKARSAKQRSVRYKPDEYSFSVVWSEEDKAFIGRVLEFPSLAAHGSSPEKRIREMRRPLNFFFEVSFMLLSLS